MMAAPDQISELVRGLRHIARQNDHIIKQNERAIQILEAKRAGLFSFLRAIWKSFSGRLSTNIGNWMAGALLWLLSLEVLGLGRLLERLAGFFG